MIDRDTLPTEVNVAVNVKCNDRTHLIVVVSVRSRRRRSASRANENDHDNVFKIMVHKHIRSESSGAVERARAHCFVFIFLVCTSFYIFESDVRSMHSQTHICRARWIDANVVHLPRHRAMTPMTSAGRKSVGICDFWNRPRQNDVAGITIINIMNGTNHDVRWALVITAIYS